MTKKTWYELSVVVMIIVRDGSNVLLGQRHNTGFKDGCYALPGGKHDGHETLRQSVAREAKEELGVTVALDDIILRSTIHYIDYDLDQELIYTVFELINYQGKIINNEPHRCCDLRFFDRDQLPENTTDMTRLCIENTFNDVRYSEFGFNLMANLSGRSN